MHSVERSHDTLDNSSYARNSRGGSAREASVGCYLPGHAARLRLEGAMSTTTGISIKGAFGNYIRVSRCLESGWVWVYMENPNGTRLALDEVRLEELLKALKALEEASNE